MPLQPTTRSGGSPVDAVPPADDVLAYRAVLPLHPPPSRGESFSSYLARLAEANQVTRLRDLAALVLGPTPLRLLDRFADFPHTCLPAVARASACAESILRTTTFASMLTRFGLDTPPSPSHGSRTWHFLAASLAPATAYCPQCLIEAPFFRLLWRIVLVRGCAVHGRRLLPACTRCGAAIHPLQAPLRVPHCAHCGLDLRESEAPQLLPGQWQQCRHSDAEFQRILWPTPAEPMSAAQCLAIGELLACLRSARHEQVEVAAYRSQVRHEHLARLERGELPRSTLLALWRYTRHLEIPLADLLAANELGTQLTQARQAVRTQYMSTPHGRVSEGPAGTMRRILGVRSTRLDYAVHDLLDLVRETGDGAGPGLRQET